MMTILAAFLFAYYFVNIAMIPTAIKRGFKMHPGTRIKPFDCVSCLSAWTAAVLYFMPKDVVEFMCIMFGAGLLGNKLSK